VWRSLRPAVHILCSRNSRAPAPAPPSCIVRSCKCRCSSEAIATVPDEAPSSPRAPSPPEALHREPAPAPAKQSPGGAGSSAARRRQGHRIRFRRSKPARGRGQPVSPRRSHLPPPKRIRGGWPPQTRALPTARRETQAGSRDSARTCPHYALASPLAPIRSSATLTCLTILPWCGSSQGGAY